MDRHDKKIENKMLLILALMSAGFVVILLILLYITYGKEASEIAMIWFNHFHT